MILETDTFLWKRVVIVQTVYSIRIGSKEDQAHGSLIFSWNNHQFTGIAVQ